MKKHFILLSTFAAWMVSAMLLTACGEEVQEANTEEEVGQETVTEESASTIFSTTKEGTRTSMDADRKFYWTTGDQIYVNTEGTTYKKTSKSTLSADQARADFVLEGVKLTEPTCSVVYIGNGTSSASVDKTAMSVTIEKTQTQTEWGNAEHIGPSGDCGVDLATKDESGKYTFMLNHKAAYLMFQPYKEADITRQWSLIKIEIIADDTNIAGTYDFSTHELVGTGSHQIVELFCNGTINSQGFATGGFDLSAQSSAENSCFAVIAPGRHKLKIRYHIKPELGYYPGQIPVQWKLGRTITFDREIPLRNYNVNGVTTIKHKFGVMVLEDFEYLQWGATKVYNESYPIGTRGEFDETTIAPDELQTTTPFDWTSLPNVNEMYSYLHYGDMHVDKETMWTHDGGATVWKNGIWLKKRANIPEFSDAIGKNGEDMREFASSSYTWAEERQYIYKDCSNPNVWDQKVRDQEIKEGLPDESVRDQYFFLPLLGVRVAENAPNDYPSEWYNNKTVHCYYWTKNPTTNPYGKTAKAMALVINLGTGVYVTETERVAGSVFAPKFFK